MMTDPKKPIAKTKPCPLCDGVGEIELLWLEDSEHSMNECYKCHGSGTVEADEDEEEDEQ